PVTCSIVVQTFSRVMCSSLFGIAAALLVEGQVPLRHAGTATEDAS
ncbi:MAG: hypothetical protein ACI9DE_002689, partial [Halioglobus sp.]